MKSYALKLKYKYGKKCYDGYEFLKDFYHFIPLQMVEITKDSERKKTLLQNILRPTDSKRVILIRGAPGVGKSTSAWQLCRIWEEQYDLVIHFNLKDTEELPVEIDDVFSSCPKKYQDTVLRKVKERAGKGVLIILDGFDELNEGPTKKYIKKLIDNEEEKLEKCDIIVTSRSSAVDQLQYSMEVEILGFTEENSRDYISKLFCSHYGKNYHLNLLDEPLKEKVKDKIDEFLTYIKGPGIYSILSVPINIVIMANIFWEDENGEKCEIPGTLTELYRRFCLVHSRKKLKKEFGGRYTFKQLIDKLEDLCESAFSGIKENRQKFTDETSPFDAGFLVKREGISYVKYYFPHLTFQEFFAACHISRNSDKVKEWFDRYGNKKEWKVVWNFVAGLKETKLLEIVDLSGLLSYHDDGSVEVSQLFLQFAFESQCTDFKGTDALHCIKIETPEFSALDIYATGYCVAKFSWSISLSFTFCYFDGQMMKFFTEGYNNVYKKCGIIQQLHVIFLDRDCIKQLCATPGPFKNITNLTLKCAYYDAEMNFIKVRISEVSEFIQHITKLEKFEVDFGYGGTRVDILVKFLHQLCHISSLQSLGFANDPPTILDTRNEIVDVIIEILKANQTLEYFNIGYYQGTDAMKEIVKEMERSSRKQNVKLRIFIADNTEFDDTIEFLKTTRCHIYDCKKYCHAGSVKELIFTLNSFDPPTDQWKLLL